MAIFRAEPTGVAEASAMTPFAEFAMKSQGGCEE
jgi:hypothetical protein